MVDGFVSAAFQNRAATTAIHIVVEAGRLFAHSVNGQIIRGSLAWGRGRRDRALESGRAKFGAWLRCPPATGSQGATQAL